MTSAEPGQNRNLDWNFVVPVLDTIVPELSGSVFCKNFEIRFQSNNMENEIASKAVERWADSEVEAFLSIYSEDRMQGTRRNTEVYQTISLRLAQKGIYHTPKQCREKIKKLKQDYKKAKETIQLSGGARGRTSKWFNSLDLILGNRSALSEDPVTFDATAWNDDCKVSDITATNNLDLDSSSVEGKFDTPITRLNSTEIAK